MANAFAERWIGTLRLVVDYIDHYNQHRPHRSLHQQPPKAPEAPPPLQGRHLRVAKSTRCDGLINEYRHAIRPAMTPIFSPHTPERAARTRIQTRPPNHRNREALGTRALGQLTSQNGQGMTHLELPVRQLRWSDL
ncbi:MAG: hypothetical protein ACI81L_000893 [Verrucomicrobiales bacterium]